MNNETKINNIEDTINEEDIILESPMSLIEEAKNIAETTVEDEKHPFTIQYDVNYREFLISMIQTSGAVVEKADDEDNILDTQMNMTQLAFIKRLDCVERVKTDEGSNPFLAEEAIVSSEIKETAVSIDETISSRSDVVASSEHIMMLAMDEPIAMTNNEAEVTSVYTDCDCETGDGATGDCTTDDCETGDCETGDCGTGSCNCQANSTMNAARRIEVETLAAGNICCPGSEQWFEFTPPQSGTYTIYTTGSLDTVGTLYDCCGNMIVTVDDYAPCGKLNFRIIHPLNAGETYYLKVSEGKNNIGGYYLKVTQKRLVESVSISPSTIILDADTTYELPILPNTFTGVNGAEPLSNLIASTVPSTATERMVIWYSSDINVVSISIGWHNGERYQTLTPLTNGIATIYAYDWNGHGKRGECTVYVSDSTAPKATVISCINKGWITTSRTMGEDMATAFGDASNYVVKTPTNEASFEACWKATNECMVIHTHGSPDELLGYDDDKFYLPIISKDGQEILPINNKIRFIIVTACQTAGGIVNDNVAYWLSKRINPAGIVIANTDTVLGDDKQFYGKNKKPTWKVYKNGVIQNPISAVTLTMTEAYNIYQQYR